MEKFVFAFMNDGKWRIDEVLVEKIGTEYKVFDGDLSLLSLSSVFFPVQFFPTMIFSAWLARRGFMKVDMDTFKILSLPVCFGVEGKEAKNG